MSSRNFQDSSYKLSQHDFSCIRNLPCTVHGQLKDDYHAHLSMASMASAEVIDKGYNSVVADFLAQFKNIEPFLLIKSAMLRRKYPSEQKQHFWLELFYREGVDTDEKSSRIFQQAGRFPSYHGHYHFVLDLESDLNKVLIIASDDDLRRVAGEVFPLSA